MRYRILDEARLTAMKPLIEPIVTDLVAAYDEVLRAAATGDGCIARELEVVQRYVFELETLGGSVRSLEPLRIEFVAEQDGAIGYIPWCPVESGPLAFRSLAPLCDEAAKQEPVAA